MCLSSPPPSSPSHSPPNSTCRSPGCRLPPPTRWDACGSRPASAGTGQPGLLPPAGATTRWPRPGSQRQGVASGRAGPAHTRTLLWPVAMLFGQHAGVVFAWHLLRGLICLSLLGGLAFCPSLFLLKTFPPFCFTGGAPVCPLLPLGLFFLWEETLPRPLPRPLFPRSAIYFCLVCLVATCGGKARRASRRRETWFRGPCGFWPDGN